MKNPNLKTMVGFRRKLEDIVQSLESIAAKVGHIQVDLFDSPDKGLEQSMEQLAARISGDCTFVKNVLDDYTTRLNASHH